MTGQAIIRRIIDSCKKHNIKTTELKVKMENFDIDTITEFDKSKNIIILHRKDWELHRT